MKRLLAASVAFLAIPTIAASQDFSGAVTLGFAQSSVSGYSETLNQLSFDGRIRAQMGNGLSFGAKMNSVQLNSDEFDSAITGNQIGVDAAFKFTNDMQVGGFYEREQMDVDGEGISGNTYGISAGYAANGLSLDGFYSRTESKDLVGTGVKLSTLGASARYQAMPNLTLGGSLASTTVSEGGDSLDMNMFGLAAVYQANADLAVFGGIARSSIDLVDLSGTNFGIGASYNLQNSLNFPALVSLELARSTGSFLGSSGHLDSVRLGLTIPLGKAANKVSVPLNSVADSVFEPTHNVLSSSLFSTF